MIVREVPGPTQRSQKVHKRSFTEDVAEALKQLLWRPGMWTINGSQRRLPAEGCGVGYFYQATTEKNERGQEIIVEWSSGCGNVRRGEWRQTV